MCISAMNIMSFFMRYLATAMIWCLVSLTIWSHLLHTIYFRSNFQGNNQFQYEYKNTK